MERVESFLFFQLRLSFFQLLGELVLFPALVSSLPI